MFNLIPATAADWALTLSTMLIWFGCTALYFVALDLLIPPASRFSYRRKGGIRFIRFGLWNITVSRSKA